jgi:predicted O-methyltransferase YrrM
MYGKFRLARKFLHYWFTAYNGKGHGMHSPFVYDLIRHVLMDEKSYPAYEVAERYKEQLLQDERTVSVEDPGAGSGLVPARMRRVCDIARTSAKHKRYGRLLYRMASYYGSGNILELGTSLGVTATYLAGVPGLAKLVTVEGVPAIADLAQVHFESSLISKVDLVRGDFDDVLPGILNSFTPDLVFIDGNHREEPTLRYFEQFSSSAHQGTILVFDDIHWSEGMEAAWRKICADPRVRLSVDLFFIGLVFYNPDFREKQHFSIRF